MTLVAACAPNPADSTRVCRDPVTQACHPCPGSSGCVDPVQCMPIACGIIAFGDTDAGADGADAGETLGDASKSEGLADAPDADAKAETGVDTDTDAPAEVAPDGQATDLDVAKDVALADGALCAVGEAQCSGNTPQLCQAGKWVAQPACAGDLQCQKGICGCKDPCPALNLVQCVDGVPATKTCQLTGSGCLSWNLPVACKPGEVCQLGICQAPPACNPGCPPGQVCQGNVCIDAPCAPACPSGQSCQKGVCVPKGGGTLSCAQVVACIGNCPAGDAGCPDSCKAKGSDAALGLLAGYQGCIKAVCKPLADAGKLNETLLCMYTNCFAEQKACTGAGTASCKQLSECLSGCGGSSTCANTCGSSASQQGGLDYYGLLTCIDNLCAGLAGDAQLQCAQQACKAGWDKCFGGAGALYTTCLQIAQCQGKCSGDITCAKACKAAGTPAAQAAVDAFIDCRDGKCGPWCSNPGLPSCADCVELFCASQLAACSF